MLVSQPITFDHSRNDFVSRQSINSSRIRRSFFFGRLTNEALSPCDWRHHQNSQQQGQGE
jgi:hypothetical protein